jgi:hypothetical protein
MGGARQEKSRAAKRKRFAAKPLTRTYPQDLVGRWNRLSRAMAKRSVVEAGGRATLGVSTAVRAPRLEGETTTRILPVAAIRSRLRSIFQSQASGQGLK